MINNYATVEEIADIFQVQPEDVAIRSGASLHLYINQRRLCGGDDFNSNPIFAGIKIPTHYPSLGHWYLCKKCEKHLSKKMECK